ncbi:unnamed protein product [Clavelina lepadiformis]|uniref:Uncharacterized protein n=1 Tax=Clavelina lepadiformis TaxID=159417 RepID=A0ABP0FI23_CLALP
MPTDSEYGDDIRLLDDLTRLKLRLIDKKLKPNSSPRYQRRRSRSPDYSPTPPPPPERRRERFHRRIDRRNELLQKLWEELGNGEHPHHRHRSSWSLPPLSPHPMTRREENAPWMEQNLWNKTGNTKKDLMELMLIQNSQMQQWMMTQTLQRHQAAADSDGAVHNHYYDSAGRALPPIRRADAGSQYPQDFFQERSQPVTRERTDLRQVDAGTPAPKGKSRRRRR